MRDRLRRTVGKEDGFRPIMACHHSKPGAERPCIGYVVIEGWRNLDVRVMAVQGRLDLVGIYAAAQAATDLDLWESFDAMLAAYEAALEGGGE